MKLYVGADHNGFEMKQQLIEALRQEGHEVVDAGNHQLEPTDDFPNIAARTITALQADPDAGARAILICGSGQGVCMAANRYKGIRASLVWSKPQARASRNDDDSNVLCLPARFMAIPEAVALTIEWLQAPFDGAERFTRRIKELDELG